MSEQYIHYKPTIVYVMGRGKKLGGYYYQLSDVTSRIGPFPTKADTKVAVSQHIHDIVSRAGCGTGGGKVENRIM